MVSPFLEQILYLNSFRKLEGTSKFLPKSCVSKKYNQLKIINTNKAYSGATNFALLQQ